MFRFVEGEQIIHRNEGQKNTEELHDEGWINDVAFHVFVAGHLSQKVKTSSLLGDATTSRLSRSGFDCGKTN
jgi:hypothetical protein